MLRFFVYTGAAFLVQIVVLLSVLVILNVMDVKDTGGWVEWPIIALYLWPLFLLKMQGHGGELLFAPLTVLLYSVIIGLFVAYRKMRGFGQTNTEMGPSALAEARADRLTSRGHKD